MPIPPRLQIELDDLRKNTGLEIIEDPDCINVVLKAFSLGASFSIDNSDILIKVPKTYPEAGPDMFWTQPELTFKGGRVPQAAEHLENHIGRTWRRFSWHRARWTPSVDNLHGYIQFIRKRLEQPN
jgi:hypothetical protein